MTKTALPILSTPPCEGCQGTCCLKGSFYHNYAVEISEEESEVLTKYKWVKELDYYIRVLPYRKGRCVYLGDDNRCTVYEQRPAACRAYSCLQSYLQWGPDAHGSFLQKQPQVRALIEQLRPEWVAQRKIQQQLPRKQV